ncbi:E3 ubiquitin ligase complex SCF subunit sconC [Grifola frondosa]|uniref:E3 ubiquitin ligase complex SCF subunit n=1 Tax=Grifola frondosa TaxID=5627 RepID=A0A1C7LWX3_GRIFR|nr:E3 ubiquitin ligase complex SCF subunit sconC [Grifola frondosa]
MVTFITSDEKRIKVDNAIIANFGLLGEFARNNHVDSEPVPLLNIDSTLFKKILEYCDHYREAPTRNVTAPGQTHFTANRRPEIGEWDRAFMAGLERSTLFGIIKAADYLGIRSLLDLGCVTVANMMIGKSASEISLLFGGNGTFNSMEAQVCLFFEDFTLNTSI